MGVFILTNNNVTTRHCDIESLVKDLGVILAYRQCSKLLISIPRTATAAIQRISELFKKHHVEFVLTVNSHPEAIDYVLNSALGGLVGTSAGAVSSLGMACVMKGFAAHKMTVGLNLFIPHASAVIGVGTSVVGFAVGALAGAKITRMGLDAKFSIVTPGNLEFAVVPQPA